MDSNDNWKGFAQLLRRPSFVIKFVELVLAVIGTVLLQDSSLYGTTPYTAQLVCMVYPGFILITLINTLGMVFAEIPKLLVVLWALAGGILWMVAGIILIESHYYIEDIFFPGGLHQKQMTVSLKEEIEHKLAAGALGLTNGVVHLVELCLVLKSDPEE